MEIQKIAQELLGSIKKRTIPRGGGCLILLMGAPYAGKSTLAKALQEQGWVHLWATVIKKRYGLEDKEMLELALAVAEKLLVEGYAVAFDSLNHTQALRAPFIGLAEALGKEYHVVYVQTDKEELRKRQAAVAEEGGSEGRSLISWEVVDGILEEVEVPSDEAHLIVVRNGDRSALERWVRSESISNIYIMKPHELAKNYLESNIVMQLATVSNGTPQLCSVHYAFDEALNLYWFSSRASHHSTALRSGGDVAAGILHNVEERQCVHLSGYAQAASGEVLTKAHAAYSQRFGDNPERLQKSLSDDPEVGAYYVCAPRQVVLFDAQHFPDEPRQEYQVG